MSTILQKFKCFAGRINLPRGPPVGQPCYKYSIHWIFLALTDSTSLIGWFLSSLVECLSSLVDCVIMCELVDWMCVLARSKVNWFINCTKMCDIVTSSAYDMIDWTCVLIDWQREIVNWFYETISWFARYLTDSVNSFTDSWVRWINVWVG